MKRIRKQNILWLAAAVALGGGGVAAAKIYTARNAQCETPAAGHTKECDHHAAEETAGHSHGEPGTELPPGHPAVSKGERISAPPLDEKQLAKGKASDCPYMSQAGNDAPAQPQKKDAISDLKDFVLERSNEGGKAR